MHIKVENGERRVDDSQLISAGRLMCDHAKQRLYVQRQFDILNGLEVVVTRCCNCHATIALEVKRLG
jgi:hypothetical protein